MNWEPGTCYMKWTEEGRTTLSMHRCWNITNFQATRIAEASTKKDAQVRFITEEQFKKEGGK